MLFTKPKIDWQAMRAVNDIERHLAERMASLRIAHLNDQESAWWSGAVVGFFCGVVVMGLLGLAFGLIS